MTAAFWITTLVIVATPGTGVLYTVGAALARGWRASLLAAFACTLGIVPHVAAAVTGLAALLHASALAFESLRFAGVAYLVYLAWKTWRDHGALEVDETQRRPDAWSVIRTGVLINLLNPKLTLFFFAFLPQFVRPGPDALPQMLVLSAAFMAVTLAVFAIYGLFASVVRQHVLGRPNVATWLRRGFAATYVLLAARLATTER
jgi:threonine/homoserine/homoserine lactone efflux protein